MQQDTPHTTKRIQRILREYMTNEVNWLKQYLGISDEDKYFDISQEFYYFFSDFIKENKDEIIEEFGDEIYLEAKDSSDNGEEIEFLGSQENRSITIKYGEWVYNNRWDQIPVDELPSWTYFDFRGIVKNQWLIHFTDNAMEIAASGFTIGMNDMRKLGLTTYIKNDSWDKKYGGYNFAFSLDGNDYKNAGRKYGDEAVVFRASGIEVYHNGDEEHQVIFYGNTATNIIPIRRGEQKAYSISDKKTGRQLYESDYTEDIVKWIEKNYDQYRSRISYE